jgi:adenylyltransferase/sulfurtransferase
MALVPELSPTELRRRWAAETQRDTVLLDVREPDEIEVAQLPEALHIPMRQVPERLADLPRDRTIVVMCHAGGRSARVAEYLIANGFEHVFNLRGGIDAWSVEVDPTIPRY